MAFGSLRMQTPHPDSPHSLPFPPHLQLPTQYKKRAFVALGESTVVGAILGAGYLIVNNIQLAKERQEIFAQDKADAAALSAVAAANAKSNPAL